MEAKNLDYASRVHSCDLTLNTYVSNTDTKVTRHLPRMKLGT